jgi:SpoVK/Ycf46/Vps4 family AAA+-type ATPase
MSSVRSEILLFSLRVAAAAAISYFSLKYMMRFIDPNYATKQDAKKKVAELLERLRLPPDLDLSDNELYMAIQLVTPEEGVEWDDVGGCDDLLAEFRDRVITPLQMKYDNTLPSSHLFSPAKGILLYGPPGCGKTLIARAIAKAAKARFMHFDLSLLTDKYYGETQKMTSALFSLAKKIQPCIIFIDEIDAFLRERRSSDHEATAMMKSQFMSTWDGFNGSDEDIIVMGATNRPHDVDKAILRRMPMRFYVPMPNEQSRSDILRVILRDENMLGDIDYTKVAREAANLSGSDLKEICRIAAISRLAAATSKGDTRIYEADVAIREEDLLQSIKKYSQSQIRSQSLYDIDERMNSEGYSLD